MTPVELVLAAGWAAFRDYGTDTDPWRDGVGLALFALGLGFAVWARIHIGRNWGSCRSCSERVTVAGLGAVLRQGMKRFLLPASALVLVVTACGAGPRRRRG